MATDGLFPADPAVVVSLFDAAFDYPLAVAEAVCTHFPFDRWGHPSKFAVVLIPSLAFYFLDAGGGEIGLYDLKDGVYFVELGLFERGSGIAVLAAAAFAFCEIADELFADHVVTYQDVVDGYHTTQI